MIQAVLSNGKHPEYGVVTVPFPIPKDEYGHVMELLSGLEIGDVLARDCRVERLSNAPPVLECLEGTDVNVDELDFLFRSIDRFFGDETAKFQAMAAKLGITEMTDLINLSFCCEKATVITDFSDLEAVGRSHYITVNGGCVPTDELEALDGYETALLLLDSGAGVITPYGIVYDNGMQLEPLYTGGNFPIYVDQPYLMELELAGLEGETPANLFLPMPEERLKRLIERAGFSGPAAVEVKSWDSHLPDPVDQAISIPREDVLRLNSLCERVQTMSERERETLAAAVMYAQPEGVNQVCRIAEELDLFDFVSGITTPEEYGKYMIRESGRFEYDENLEAFYDYAGYGQQRIYEEGGEFLDSGYVSYHGEMSMKELMREDPAEEYRMEMKEHRAALITVHLRTLEAPGIVGRTYRLGLPATEEELDAAKDKLGMDYFTEAFIDKIEFGQPYLEDLIPQDCFCVEDANELALSIEEMMLRDGELLKYLSLLSLREPETLGDALRLAEELDDYERATEFEDGVQQTEYGFIRRINEPVEKPDFGQKMM